MVRVFSLGVVVAAVLGIASCTPKVNPGLVVSGLVSGEPTGEANASEPASIVVATFDRAMVSTALVGQVAAKPCIIRPRVEGASVDDRSRPRLLPQAPLPRSTLRSRSRKVHALDVWARRAVSLVIRL
jgi:hypothetical protein